MVFGGKKLKWGLKLGLIKVVLVVNQGMGRFSFGFNFGWI